MSRILKADKEAFLAALADGGTVTKAAEQAGHAKWSFYRLRERDETFGKAWAEAYEQGTDRLEDEARRRAVDGVDEPVFYQGQTVGSVRRHSDTLLIFLLKARRPEKFHDQARLELGAKGGDGDRQVEVRLSFSAAASE